jgi:hypothetical protein
MKKSVWIICSLIALQACRTPWTEEEKGYVLQRCILVNAPLYTESKADSICQCYLEKLMERFPENDQKPADILPIINECAEEFPL